MLFSIPVVCCVQSHVCDVCHIQDVPCLLCENLIFLDYSKLVTLQKDL